MSVEASFAIRVMTRAEVDLALDWAAQEGWNPGLHDASCFYAADPDGFLVGLLDDQPVATISVVKYGESFAFLGCYIVRPEFRGRGCGLKIWNTGMESLRGRCVGLDGVLAQQPNYRKSGFELSHRNIRYAGTGGGASEKPPGIVPLATRPFAEILAYDRKCFPAERSEFLKCWIAQPEVLALGMVRHGSLAGYGVLRACRDGFKVGPIFADDPVSADNLFQTLRARVPATSSVYLDVPELKRGAVELAERSGLRPVFETARMYAGGIPAIDWSRVYGVTTFELG